MRHRILALLLAAGLGSGFRTDAGEKIHIYVNSRAFDVSVAPVDEESRLAESSILYQRADDGAEWEALGECRKDALPNGDVRFTRLVRVERDGSYQYTSRPVVGGDVEHLPVAGEAPQAVVIVDTLPPTAEILRPEGEFTVKAGETVRLEWTVSDENLGDAPAAFTYSGDGGRSWSLIRRDLPPEGGIEWKTPNDLIGPAVVRLAAVDKAGNVGRAVQGMEAAKPDAPPASRPAAPALARGDGEPDAGAPRSADGTLRDPNRSWLYYLMALNLMRQNKPADALQYYWLSVKADPEFINAWADIALAYNELGAYQTARDVVEQTRDRAPDRIDLVHLLGETYHAEGMDLLGRARSAEDRQKAKQAIDQAVGWYGHALDRAAKEWRLAEQAASFYRLGEICYYVNLDPDGARAYWEKILKLHVPTPNSDLLQWSTTKDKSWERRRYEKNTDQWVSLHTWQSWAHGYLEQMAERDRKGILDMMAAQKVRRTSSPAPSLSYSGNDMNPGREDGRSLFSLPAQLGSPDDVAACVGVAGQSAAGIGGANEVNFPAHINRPPVTDGYSFYAPERQPDSAGRPQTGATGKRGLFSPHPAPAPQHPRDPYAFPMGNRDAPASWNNAAPYGSQPITDW